MPVSPPDVPQLTSANLPDASEAALARERIRHWSPRPGSLEARVLSAAMTEFGAWRLCARRECRRASRCAAARVECFALDHAFVCARLRPRLVAALQAKDGA